jgi:PIN domain nuclease of toxin-antitoxin system
MTATTVTGWLLDTHALLWMLHGDKRLGLGILSVNKSIDDYEVRRVW